MRSFVIGLTMLGVAAGVGCGESAPPNVPLAAPDDPGRPAPATTAAPIAATPSVDEDTRDAASLDPATANAEILAGIREISPNEHVITARAFDLFLARDADLMRQYRFVPDPSGMRIFGVRNDSVLAHLGLQNGDRVDRLMGQPTGTTDEAQAAYGSLRGASVVELDVDRRGGKQHLVVRVE